MIMGIDDILWEQEHKQFDKPQSDEALNAARKKIKQLRSIAATNVYIVHNKEDKRFYGFCKKNKLPYGKHYDGRRITMMSPETYLVFKLSGIEHTSKFHTELTYNDLLKWALT